MNGPHCINLARWKSGDVVGVSLDLQAGQAYFQLNGKLFGGVLYFNPTVYSGELFYPSASFTCFQHARFNFGVESYR